MKGQGTDENDTDWGDGIEGEVDPAEQLGLLSHLRPVCLQQVIDSSFGKNKIISERQVSQSRMEWTNFGQINSQIAINDSSVLADKHCIFSAG